MTGTSLERMCVLLCHTVLLHLNLQKKLKNKKDFIANLGHLQILG